MTMTEAQLGAALRQPVPAFAADALRVAMADSALATRVAMPIFAEAIAAARENRCDNLGFGPVYAAYLVAYHRDRAAWEPFREIARLPSEQDDPILGDAVTDDGCALLWSVCGDDADPLLALVDDLKADEYWQAGALRGIGIGVAHGALDGEQMLQALTCRLEALIARRDPEHAGDSVGGRNATWIASTITDLGVGDAGAMLDQAYAFGLIEGIVIRPEEWHDAARMTHEALIAAIQQRYGWRYPVNPLGLKNWACFRTDAHQAERQASTRATRPETKTRASQKARERRRTQRKARRKNRSRG